MTQQQNRLIHELVEQSRDRVTHVRAGQRLLDVLDSQQHPLGTGLPPPVISTLVPLHEPTKRSGRRRRTRKRAAIVLASTTTPSPSSYAQYTQYADSKLTQSESIHMLDRRKAVATNPATPLAKLVSRLVTKQQEEEASTAETKLLHAVAAVKGRNAFLSLKTKKPSRLSHLPEVKNTHLAFLAFQSSSASPRTTTFTTRASGDLARLLNAATREPIRFGDAVCLLSAAANVPLAIGRNGRTMVVENAVAGPHMVFTVVDFGDPSRRDTVAMGEGFWLRVNAAQLDGGEQDEIVALLIDTQYFLGGPGSMEEDNDGEEKVHRRGAARKYACAPTYASDQCSVFKLVSMKATVPSAAYYGDDAATREYATETNAHVMRLAQWKFTAMGSRRRRRQHRPHKAQSDTDGDTDGDRDQLVLNCASVGLALGEFALDYDSSRRRGVLRGSLTRENQPSHQLRQQQRDTSVWQVRLMQRGEPPPLPPPPASSHDETSKSPTDKQALEWLQRHHDRVERDTKRVNEKRLLAHKAHAAYDNVATRSNAQLLQIENTKAMHVREYFQSRFEQVLGRHEMSTKIKNKTRLPRL